MLIDTIPLLAAVKAHLQALRMPDAEDVPLFDLVDFYSERDLQGGLGQLLKSTAKRACLIVPGGDTYEQDNDTPCNIILLKRTTDFSLLLADKSYKPGAVEAAFGGSETLGAINIKDIVVRALTGKTLGLDDAGLVPGNGSLLTAGNQDKARPFWIQEFIAFTGSEEFPVA